MTQAILAVDLGGTKILVQLSTLDGDIVVEQRYESHHFDSFEAVLAIFFVLPLMTTHKIIASCLAVAGPVVDQKASLTNLPWQIDAALLSEHFPMGKVLLCNDFEAVAFGIDNLDAAALITLQAGEVDGRAPRAIIGAGTGLGQAFMLTSETGWNVVSTEGGHVDFAPGDDEQVALWSYLNQQFGHVSYERVLSGAGLVAIYRFLAQQGKQALSDEMQVAIVNNEAPALISQLALSGDALADKTLQLFMSIYGAQAGNLAMSIVARGGLYIAGGVAAKNQSHLRQGHFMAAFLRKGKMAELMALIPVILITDETVGLSGARYLALQSAL